MSGRKSLLLVSSFLWVMPTAMAQVTTSTILGAITDASGAAMPGVQVKVKDVGTGFERVDTTAADGTYIVENLKPGRYSVSAGKTGFRTKTVEGITVVVADRVRVDIHMEVGAATQRVDVQATAPVVETDSSTVGKVIGTSEVLELPLNGRNFIQLAALTPGVQNYEISFMDKTGGTISVNGMSAYSNVPLIDGIYNQDTGASRMNFSPSVDMIQEFKLQTNSYDAEFGISGGSQVNILTKRGTNTYHGSLFEFLRNNDMDARPFFQVGPLAHFSRNEFGATLGGKIPGLKKDFFFASYEGLRSVQGLTAVLTVPTAAMKEGDFTATGETIYDPSTYDPTSGLRQPFAPNSSIIPTNRISQQANFFNTFYPNPQTSGFVNNYVSNPIAVTSNNEGSFRYDRDFSEKDTLTVRYTRKNMYLVLPLGDCACTTPLPGFGENDPVVGQNHKIGWTHIFNPTTVNTLNLGFSQYFEDRTNQDQGPNAPNFITEAGISGVSRQQDGFPDLSISGYTGLNDSYVSGVNSPQNNYIITDTLSKVWGKHSFKAGGQFLYDRAPTYFDAFTRGITYYNPVYSTAFANAPGDQFSAYADFLLGVPDSDFIYPNQLQLDLRERWAAGFFQDNWNVTKDLTLNLGVRYEVFTPPYDERNRVTALDVNTGQWVYPGTIPVGQPGVPANSVTAASVGFPSSLQVPTTHNDWGPRLGFAWRMFGNNKTVLRGGYATFWNWAETDDITDWALGSTPWDPSTSINCNSTVPCVTSAKPFSTTIVPSSGGGAANNTNRTPYTQQYSLGIQRELAPTLGLEVGYVGNAGTKDWFTYQFNAAQAGPGPLSSREPFPQYSSLSGMVSWGNSHYDSLQVALRKTYDPKGLVLLASYTWSHALGDAVSGPEFEETYAYRNWYDWKADKGNTPYDLRQILSVSWVYELPVGTGKALAGTVSGLANGVIGGWKFGGIASVHTGPFITPDDVVNVSNAGGNRPDMIANPNNQSRPNRNAAVNEWFNTNAFQRASLYTFGNAGTGVIEAPGLANIDLSLYKTYQVMEGKRLEFRAEFFNAFNRPNFGPPGVDFGTGDFGIVSSVSTPGRDIQLGLRFDF